MSAAGERSSACAGSAPWREGAGECAPQRGPPGSAAGSLLTPALTWGSIESLIKGRRAWAVRPNWPSERCQTREVQRWRRHRAAGGAARREWSTRRLPGGKRDERASVGAGRAALRADCRHPRGCALGRGEDDQHRDGPSLLVHRPRDRPRRPAGGRARWLRRGRNEEGRRPPLGQVRQGIQPVESQEHEAVLSRVSAGVGDPGRKVSPAGSKGTIFSGSAEDQGPGNGHSGIQRAERGRAQFARARRKLNGPFDHRGVPWSPVIPVIWAVPGPVGDTSTRKASSTRLQLVSRSYRFVAKDLGRSSAASSTTACR